MSNKKIVFLTGTRADFGKLKPIIKKIEKSSLFDNYIFATGMHVMKKYGFTINEIKKQKYNNIYTYINQSEFTDLDIILSNTILGFGNYIKEMQPDLIVVHGDRVEALAGAIVGSFNNIKVAHIEGGEVSGTIDEIIRHSVSKLSNIHFVANEIAKERLIKMGENKENIFVIGSPEVDIILSDKLPDINFVKVKYDISFENYGIFIYHPVTTELKTIKKDIEEIVEALVESNENYIIIHPNNDEGSNFILEEILKLKQLQNFKLFPSIRFENFLSFMKNMDFIIGNSSCGVREAPIFGVPTINIGTRQKNRNESDSIHDINPNKEEIIKKIKLIKGKKYTPFIKFGDGNSAEKFFEILKNENIWKISNQKFFIDI